MRFSSAALRLAEWSKPLLCGAAGVLGAFSLAVLLSLLLQRVSPTTSHSHLVRVAAVLAVLLFGPLCFQLGLLRQRLASLNRRFAETVAKDSLTSCLNSGVFSAMVDAHPILSGSGEGRRNGALLIVDIDSLGGLNGEAGYRAGDQALRIVAEIVRASVRKGDLVGRITGHQFSVFLPGATYGQALGVAERIRNGVFSAQFKAAGSKWQLSVSIGAVLFEHQADFDELVQTASRQLRIAKKVGRNQVAYAQLDVGQSGSSPVRH